MTNKELAERAMREFCDANGIEEFQHYDVEPIAGHISPVVGYFEAISHNVMVAKIGYTEVETNG